MKHITRAQRPHGRRSEYTKAVALCQPAHSKGMRWAYLVSLYELEAGWVVADPATELCPACRAAWVDVKLTKRWEQPGDEYQGPSLAESVHL